MRKIAKKRFKGKQHDDGRDMEGRSSNITEKRIFIYFGVWNPELASVVGSILDNVFTTASKSGVPVRMIADPEKETTGYVFVVDYLDVSMVVMVKEGIDFDIPFFARSDLHVQDFIGMGGWMMTGRTILPA